MPKTILRNAAGDTWTITLDNGEVAGSIMRVRSGKYNGGTFSAKTPELALKNFYALIEEEKEYGFYDPKEKANKTPKTKAGKVEKKPSITTAQWKAWWKGLTAEWKSALNAATECDADEDGFEAIAGMTDFDAPEADLDDLAPLTQLTGLRSLNLYGNSFSDLKPLQKLTQLKSLYIDNCTEVENLKPLEKLTGLEELNIGYTSVSDLKPLHKLKKLKTLFVPGLNEQFDDWKAELTKLKAALPKCRVATAE